MKASTKQIVDPTDPKEMAIFGPACVLAKHLQYAYAEAFLSPAMRPEATPVSLWQATSPAAKEQWILRGMELLKSLDPQQIPVRQIVTGLGGIVIGQITPHQSARSCGCDPGAGWVCQQHQEGA